MSTCAVMVVRDEADIIEATVRHLLWHVDEVIVADNRSVDGTREILERLPVDLRDDPEVAFRQSRKTTGLAMTALERGHEWVLPCDADEIWHCTDPNHRISDWLSTVAPDVMIVKGNVLNHIASAEDDPREENPARRIGYRRIRSEKKKAACRLRFDLLITEGNHTARYTAGTVKPVRIEVLKIRHFPCRSEEQTVRKIRNQIEAFSAAGRIHGRPGRQYDGRPDEDIRDDFRRFFFSECPTENADLIHDPAPIASDWEKPLSAV